MKILHSILSIFPVSLLSLLVDWLCPDDLPLPDWASRLCQSNRDLDYKVRMSRTITSQLTRATNDWADQFDLSLDTEFLKNIPLRYPLPIAKSRSFRNPSLLSCLTMACGAALTAWVVLMNPLSDNSVPVLDSHQDQPAASLASVNLPASDESVRFPSKVVVPTGFLGIPARGIQEVSSAVKMSFESEIAQTLETTQQAVMDLPKQIFPPDLRRSALNLYAQADY